MKLPEKVRKALDRVVREMRVKEGVYGIGLFGSWSRGDAASSSDVDLLILDNENFAYEYVERVHVGGFFVDLDHVPRSWIRGPIPPEVDQKLYEMQILYDRDWSLTNTKLLTVKSYSSPERVDIRTEAHVVESDVYLSRATSAFSRQDFRSSFLFTTVCLENILKVLIELASRPFSNSRFLEVLEESATLLGMSDLFNEYLQMTGLNRVDNACTSEKLGLFRTIWDEINVTAKQNFQELRSLHFRVRTRLTYYLNPAFVQGALARATDLFGSGKTAEGLHYMNNILLDLVENYLWLRSSVDNVRIDYTTLIRSLECLEERNPRNYENVVKFLGLDDADKNIAAKGIEKARRIVLKVRKDRKVLIKNHLLES